MEVRLNDNELMDISNLFSGEEEGVLHYENGAIEIAIAYTTKIYGYREDDYFNGTGAFVIEDVSVNITDAYIVDSEAELIFDENKLISMFEKKITA